MSYCTSFYGSCLWNLQDNSVDKFYVTWHKAMRRILGAPLQNTLQNVSSHSKLFAYSDSDYKLYG